MSSGKSAYACWPQAYQKDIKLNHSWCADVDTIHGDADQLEQVFSQLFSKRHGCDEKRMANCQ